MKHIIAFSVLANLAICGYFEEYMAGDYQSALVSSSMECNRGDIDACSLAGIINMGFGNTQDAIFYLDKACQSGKYIDACGLMANIYVIEQDYSKAQLYAQKACNSGMGEGCQILGAIYQEKNDYQNASKYYRLACQNQGYGGCVLAGMFAYENGNYQDAINLYYNGCENGSNFSGGNFTNQHMQQSKDAYFNIIGIGCYNLALMYQKGEGAPKDISKARNYFSKSCALGYIQGRGR